MAAVVTGGAGFLGQALVDGLVRAGTQVRALVRRPEDEDRLRALGAAPARGDLALPGGAAGLVQAGDVIYHAAAHVDLIGSWAEFERGTVATTRHLLAAALPQRPARFVYVSSAAVYLPPREDRPPSASQFTPRPARYDYYARAKALAEALVRQECTRAGCPWVILRLGYVYGPRNTTFVARVTPLLKAGRLWLVGRGDNRIATLYVDDAAEAVALAGTHPAAVNRIYDVASAERVTQREFMAGWAVVLDVPAPKRTVPCAVALGAAMLAESWSRLARHAPGLTRTMVRLMAVDQTLDVGPIERELGWRAHTTFAEGVARTQEWYRQMQGAGGA